MTQFDIDVGQEERRVIRIYGFLKIPTTTKKLSILFPDNVHRKQEFNMLSNTQYSVCFLTPNYP